MESAQRQTFPETTYCWIRVIGRRRKLGTGLPELTAARKQRDMTRKYVLSVGRRISRIGLEPKTARLLDDSGFRSGRDLQQCAPADLMTAKRIGPKKADEILVKVGREIPARERQREYCKALAQRRKMSK
jgi:hypothetical protein